MQLSIISWSSSDLSATTDINNGTDFRAWYEANQITVPERSAVYHQRNNTSKRLAGTVTNEMDFTFKIQCLGTFHTQRETVKRYFSPESYALGTLTFADAANSNKEWYITGMPLRVAEESPGIMAITLGIDEPMLREVADSTATWTITGTAQTTDVSVGGNMAAKPILHITPTSGKSGGDYEYSRWVAIYNPGPQSFANYPFDFGGIDTADLVSSGKMKSAAGNDLRLRIDGIEVPRWFGTTDGRGVNTTDTAIWANIDLAPMTILYLREAIDSTSTTITLDKYITSPSAAQRLQGANNKVIMFENEAIIYESFSILTLRLNNCTRGAKGTSAASHAKGVGGYHIPFDSWILYGSSDAEAQVVSDDTKPMIDLHSTNTSWIYSNYWSASQGSRSAAWYPLIAVAGTGKKSYFYTDTQAGSTDPATVMGAAILPYQMLGAWKTDTATIVWRLGHPAGVTAATFTGKTYRYSTGWASLTGFQYYDDTAKLWATAYNAATPGSAQTWTAFTASSSDVTMASSNNLQFILDGSIAGSANNNNSIEFDTVILTLNSTYVPTKTIGSETSQYRINATITNNTTGDAITLDWLMALNRTLTVDCNAKTVTYDDGTNAYGALSLSNVRNNWLDLKPGTNTLQYDDAATQGVTIGIEFESRNTL